MTKRKKEVDPNTTQDFEAEFKGYENQYKNVLEQINSLAKKKEQLEGILIYLTNKIKGEGNDNNTSR